MEDAVAPSQFDVDKGNQLDTVHDPYNPSPPGPTPEIGPPTGNERPWPLEKIQVPGHSPSDHFLNR